MTARNPFHPANLQWLSSKVLLCCHHHIEMMIAADGKAVGYKVRGGHDWLTLKSDPYNENTKPACFLYGYPPLKHEKDWAVAKSFAMPVDFWNAFYHEFMPLEQRPEDAIEILDSDMVKKRLEECHIFESLPADHQSNIRRALLEERAGYFFAFDEESYYALPQRVATSLFIYHGLKTLCRALANDYSQEFLEELRQRLAEESHNTPGHAEQEERLASFALISHLQRYAIVANGHEI